LDIPGYKKLREHEDECKDTADCDEGKCEKKNAAGEVRLAYMHIVPKQEGLD